MHLFRKFFYHARSAFQRWSYVPNLKSLAQAVLKICLIICQKFRGHMTSHAPLGRVIYASSRHSTREATDQIWSLYPSNFQDIWDRLPQILGVTWSRPCPFWGKLFKSPLGFSKRKRCSKFEVSSSSSFEDMFGCIPKILGVTWPSPRPFWEILFERPLGFPR